ncbi:MAG: hypothetical protein GEU83_20890 [Pseudonocardiaceae bacterium]|nr:hypothetical protein [Pseudonocardiaceae bacterium]
MSAPAVRWALSPRDYRAHAVSGLAGDSTMAARCGHVMPVEAGLDDSPRAQLCAACVLAVAPTFEARGGLVNAARDADGCGEWFPDDK